MTVNILSPSGDLYNTRGFQPLVENQPLSLRTGSIPKQPLQNDYVLPRWCPCIDIIAIPEGRALRLVRLSGGQTVWRQTFNGGKTRQTDSEIDRVGIDDYAIRAIAWSPSGTSIAILHANGQLIQRDSTRGAIVHESYIAIDDSAVAMEWVTCKNGSEEMCSSLPEDSMHPTSLEFLIPKLSPLDRGQPTPAHINPEAEDPTAIIITSSSGLVQVSLGGIFTLPAVGLPKSMMCALHEYVAIDARLSKDSAILYVCLAQSITEGSTDVPASDHKSQDMVICAVDTSILSSTMPLLHMVVPLSARLSGLCLYLENTLDMLVKEADARDESASRTSLLNIFEGVLRDHGVEEVTSPEAELSRLAVTGCASESTSQFLLAKLNPGKLNSWESAGRLGAVALTRLIYQNALPAVERTVLAATRLLDIVRDSKSKLSYTDTDSNESDRHSADKACNAILRVIVILGWLYMRFNKYMLALRDEQRENQEFVDWALCAIDDLHWQNEGSRRLERDGHNDDADDGMRPVRPEIDYKLLLGFIRNNDSSGKQGRMYIATASESSQRLMIVATSSNQNIISSFAYIELVVDVQNFGDSVADVDVPHSAQGRAQSPICVTDVSFFDDELLGIVFTVDGDSQSYLGAVEYRPNAGTIQYHKTHDIQHIVGTSAKGPMSLTCNGNKGRRCVAVLEKRGRYWWPYDMDNEEDSSSEDNSD
ncbi:hypothetical protein H4S08_000280 [Coemansia sp. RSA 1365]|nr:hypothetical protein H4S08_000280 [Coemansia sp. RSA 1365]